MAVSHFVKFSSLFQSLQNWINERFLGTLQHRRCSRMFLFLFHVQRLPPHPNSFLFTVTPKKNQRKKKVPLQKNVRDSNLVIPRSTRFRSEDGGRRDWLMLLLLLRKEQSSRFAGSSMCSNVDLSAVCASWPAGCGSSVCVCVCVSLTSYMIFMCVHTFIQGGQEYLKVIDGWDVYCHATRRTTDISVARDSKRTWCEM